MVGGIISQVSCSHMPAVQSLHQARRKALEELFLEGLRHLLIEKRCIFIADQKVLVPSAQP